MKTISAKSNKEIEVPVRELAELMKTMYGVTEVTLDEVLKLASAPLSEDRLIPSPEWEEKIKQKEELIHDIELAKEDIITREGRVNQLKEMLQIETKRHEDEQLELKEMTEELNRLTEEIGI